MSFAAGEKHPSLHNGPVRAVSDAAITSHGLLRARLAFWLTTLGLCGALALAVWHPRGLKVLQGAAKAEACSPLAYDQGSWVARATALPQLDSLQDVYAAFGVTGCKAQFQPTWNLGLQGSPPFTAHARKMQHVWQPHSSCRLKELDMVQKLQLLIDSPLFIAGDSRSRQHFFALSCVLADHVLWKGDAPAGDDNADLRTWRFTPQRLYLDPASPLLPRLSLPKHFNISLPIVEFLMAYLPISRAEMRELSGPGVDISHVPATAPYPAYPVSELSMNASIDAFTASGSHFKTLLHSTGAHFGPAFLLNFSVPDALALLRASIRVYYAELAKRMRPDQRVFVRAAEAGQTNCDEYQAPLQQVGDQGLAFNYAYLSELNSVVEEEVELTTDDRFKWLGLERLTRLRPDAHLPGDCIHYSVGSGVYEAISRYLWHSMVRS